MVLKARTVVLIICVTMILTSISTVLISQSDVVQDRMTIGSEQSVLLPEDLLKIEEVYTLIQERYVTEISKEELVEGAVQGMLDALDDPYSVYMDAERAEQYHQSLQSVFEGIGAEVTLQDGLVTILAPIHGSPAEEAGIRSGDQILSVNGESIEGLDLHEAVMKIRGPKGTEAKLGVTRPGLSDSMEISVIRDEIPLETVYTDTIQRGDKVIGLLRISSFSQDTAERFEEELASFEAEGIDGLVIDVRGNPGGYLDSVSDIGSLVVPYNSTIVEIEGRQGVMSVFESNLDDPKHYPLTILIDEGSASASEILAAALQEAGGYKVVGQPSFGKGSVQNSIFLKDDSQVQMSIAKWLTTNGNWIHEKGVQPDIEVSQPEYFQATRISTESTLQKQDNNDQVKNLQMILKGLGFNPGDENGYFGEATERAVIEFQQNQNLSATGVVDESTAIQLEEALTDLIRDKESDKQLQKAIDVLLQ